MKFDTNKIRPVIKKILFEEYTRQLLANREKRLSQYKNEESINIINSLNPKYGNPLRLRFIDNLSYEEIAQKLNLSLSTVRTQLLRAKKMYDDKIQLKKQEKELEEKRWQLIDKKWAEFYQTHPSGNEIINWIKQNTIPNPSNIIISN